MTEQEKINEWIFEETVKTAENLMEVENNMFKWDVLRHLRDFAENFCEEVMQYRAVGTPEECRAAVEKQTAKKPKKAVVEGYRFTDTYKCPNCGGNFSGTGIADYCYHCGQKLDWSDEE